MNDATSEPTSEPISTTLYYRSVELDAELDLAAVYAAAQHHDAVFLRERSGGPTFVGLGVAHVLTTGDDSLDRFRDTARARLSLGARVKPAPLADDTDTSAEPGPEPVLLGGFAFDPPGVRPSSPRWAPLGTTRLVLPHLTFRQGRYGTLCTVVEPAGTDPTATNEVIHRLADAAASTAETLPTPPPSVSLDDLDFPAYRQLVAKALEDITAGRAAKIVCSRPVDLTVRIDPNQALRQLLERFADCTVYGLRAGTTTFIGATPELLVSTDDGVVRTDAVAGTAPRGDTTAEDTDIGERLLNDPKELAEHGYVSEYLRRALGAAGVRVADAQPPHLRKLPGLQHLVTDIEGTTASTGTTAIAMVRALHPSPAVGGTPSREALAFLAKNEGYDRGWYGGPVGWVGLDGRGSFSVALRGGLIDDHGVRLFAGGGIVAGSDPDRELAETTLKLRAMADTLFELTPASPAAPTTPTGSDTPTKATS
jgi:isochorismate synthase